MDVDYETQTGIPSLLNLRADLHHLPFRNKSFAEAKCSHVLEHVLDPRRALSEIRRVAEHGEIWFPVHDGYLREMFLSLLQLDFSGALHAWKTARKRAHRWILTPQSLGLEGIEKKEPIITLFGKGRKAKFNLFKQIDTIMRKIQWSREWKVEF